MSPKELPARLPPSHHLRYNPPTVKACHSKKSPLLRLALLLLLCTPVAVVAATTTPVVVIHGRRSLPTEGDSRFAAALGRHTVRWFRSGGITAELQDDTNLAATLRQRKVALLVHCDALQADQLQELQRFAGGGGTLIVCYSSSPGLAKLMGVKVGGYLKPPAGTFATMRFNTNRPPNTPTAIRQSSPNIFSATPLPGESTLLAEWYDRQGKPTGEAAWLQGRHGFWMTHTLLGDGDAAAKARLIVALAAGRHPELWLPAAEKRLAEAAKVGPWQCAADGLATANAISGTKRRNAALQAVREALEAEEEARKLLEAGRGAEAWLLSHELEQRLMAAYGHMQQPLKGELRAIWDHSGQGLYPGDWQRTCRELKAAGISDILVNVAAPGFAHCRLDALPRSPLYESEGDQLAACIAAARPLGLRVHAWLIAFSTTQATAHRMSLFTARNWLLLDTQGRPTPWLNPAHPEVQTMLVTAVQELFERYRIDGIHLDFVRYANLYESMGPDTRRAFEQSRGAAVPGWPEAAQKNPLHDELVGWRVAQISDFVAAVRRVQREKAPGRLVTAAVLGKYPSCVAAVGQDWESWIEQGYVDYLMPMNYTESFNFYNELVSRQSRTRSLARHLVGGIGVTAAESRLTADLVIDQVNRLRTARAAGFALFDLNPTLANEILPILKLGLTAP